MGTSRYTYKNGTPRGVGVGHRRTPLPSLKTIVFIVGAGVLTGLQIAKPSKRIIEAAVGLILMFALWNVSAFPTLLFFITIYPFPFSISLGNSDFIFILIIFIISLARARSGLVRLQSSKTLNLPIALMAASYVLSFYNVDYGADTFRFNLINTYAFASAVLLFYLCTSHINTEERLKKAVNALFVSLFFVILFTMFELLFPGRVLIPNWLYTQHGVRLVAKNIRMGGPFLDFELVAEFFALNAPVVFVCLVRSKRMLARTIYALLFLADLFMMFSTITRGAFISLVLGLIYMGIIFRRDLSFVRVAIIAGGLILIMVSMNTFVARYTTSGSLFERLFATTFTSGFIPENRYETWRRGLEQGREHLFLGHGPGMDFSPGRGLESKWLPHDLYLYVLNITGLFGLLALVFFLYRLLRMSTITMRASLVSSPFPHALMKVFHVCLLMFILDQIKIEYLRSNLYLYFIWLMFGLMAATENIIRKTEREQSLPVPSP